ncbi:MAG TPA: DUF1653 domain-containing protein [Patescibacteria group bacterium]|nr:DUF1653 domain-containing protein [Patescibacteria group bacterium]
MHEHETDEQLASRLTKAAEQVTVGAYYMHYKQLKYKVLMLALREEDNEPCVVYEAQYGAHNTWTRPVALWLQDVQVDGKTVKHFTKFTD